MLRPLLVFGLALSLAACGPSATPTPEPTATPEATATAEPTATPDSAVENEAYIDWAVASLQPMGELISGLAPLFAELQANQALRTDPDYTTRLGEQLGQIKARADVIQAYEDVPPDAKEAHATLVQFAANMETMTELWVKGLDEMDADAVTQASGLLQSAPAIVEEITAALVTLKQGQ